MDAHLRRDDDGDERAHAAVELEPGGGAAELGKIDYAKVPKGVCLNRAPTVRLLGKTARKGEGVDRR